MTPFLVYPWFGFNVQGHELDQDGPTRQKQYEIMEYYGCRGFRNNYPPIKRKLTGGTDLNVSTTAYYNGGALTWPYSWDDPANGSPTVYNAAAGNYYGTGTPLHEHSVKVANEVLARGWKFMITLCDRNVGLERMFTTAQQAIALYHAGGVADDARRFLMACAVCGNHTGGKDFLKADATWLLEQYPDHPNMQFEVQNGSEMEEAIPLGFRWVLDGSVVAPTYPRLVAAGSTTTTTSTAYPAANQVTTAVGGVAAASIQVGSIIYLGTGAVARRVTAVGGDTLTLDANVTANVGETITNGMGLTLTAATPAAWRAAFEAFYDEIYVLFDARKNLSEFVRKSCHLYDLVGGNNISGPLSSRRCTEFNVGVDTTLIGSRGAALVTWWKTYWDLGVREFWLHSPFNAAKFPLWVYANGSLAAIMDPWTALQEYGTWNSFVATVPAGVSVNVNVDNATGLAVNDYVWFMESNVVDQITGIAGNQLTFGVAREYKYREPVIYMYNVAGIRTPLPEAMVDLTCTNAYEPDVARAVRYIGRFINRRRGESALSAYW